MRPVPFLALLPFAAALAAPVQRISSRPFHGANAILLSAHRETASESLRRLAEVSQRLGYTVDSLDGDRLLTAARSVEPALNGPHTPAQYHLTAFVAKRGAGPTVIMLWETLRFTEASSQLVERPMRWDGTRDQSPASDCFRHAQQLAQAFPTEQLVSIRYTTQKDW